MQNATFIVVSHPCVHRPDNTGYSWGLLLVKEKNLIHLSNPSTRGRIAAIQHIPGRILDSFGFLSTRSIQQDDVNFMEHKKIWSVSVRIPDKFFDPECRFEVAEAICMHLRCTINGRDEDKTVYTIPENVMEFHYKEEDIRV